jgi:putative spermidine/putrescine transport system substrate-binding protein
VVTWGGSYEASQRVAYFEPFTEATGVPIEIVRYDGGIAALAAHRAAHPQPEWDVIDLLRADARTACARGLLEPFDPAHLAPAPDGTPAAEDFVEGAVMDCAVAQLIFSTVIVYDDRAFPGEKPQTIADFFDTERFPGRRALRRAPVGLFEWALRAYGVPRRQIYDLLSTRRGFDLAFRQLDRIRPVLTWWETGAEPIERLRAGEVAMASAYNGRAFHAQVVDNAPLTVIWDSQLLDYTTWAIPAGTPQKALAERFIRFATRAENLATQSNRISYGPTRDSARRRIGRHATTGVPMEPHLPTAPRHLAQAIHQDHRWYTQTEDLRWREFRAWLSRGEPGDPPQRGRHEPPIRDSEPGGCRNERLRAGLQPLIPGVAKPLQPLEDLGCALPELHPPPHERVHRGELSEAIGNAAIPQQGGRPIPPAPQFEGGAEGALEPATGDVDAVGLIEGEMDEKAGGQGGAGDPSGLRGPRVDSVREPGGGDATAEGGGDGVEEAAMDRG